MNRNYRELFMAGGIVLCFVSLWLLMLNRSDLVFSAVVAGLFGVALLCSTNMVDYDLEAQVLTIHIGPIWLHPRRVPFSQITHIEIDQYTYHSRFASGVRYKAHMYFDVGDLSLGNFSTIAEAKAQCAWIAKTVGCRIKPGPKLKELRDGMSDFE